MEEIKVNGIVLSVTEYGEKDALLTIFTVELGKITAKIRGVKSEKAKFKHACQPFCFGEWVCIKKGEYFTVTSFSLIDNFYDLTLDYDKFVLCTTFLEICNKTLRPNIISEELFVSLITSLKNIVYEDINMYLVAVKFYLLATSILGYTLSFNGCGSCGLLIKSDIYLSNVTNDFCCVPCSNRNGQLVSREVYNVLKIINTTSFDKLPTIKVKEDVLIKALILLKHNCENIFNAKIISFSKIVF